MSPSARSLAAALALRVVLVHWSPESLLSFTFSVSSPPPIYLLTRSSEVAGTYRQSLPAYCILM
jgi:hypothetical protein